MRVPLGVGNFQSASLRLCHEVGVPIAEVLLVRGQGGNWVGVIDGRLVKGPRLGLWVRVRQRGAYRGVLGSVDDPIWVEVSEAVQDISSASQPGGAGLDHVRKSNKRPTLGFPDFSPSMELARALDRWTDHFARRRHDGRMVLVDRGRIADRYQRIRLDGIDLVDPYDGALADWLYLAPGVALSARPGRVTFERSPSRGTGGMIAAGFPARTLAQVDARYGAHRVSVDGLVDWSASGLTVDEDHSTGLPSFHPNRQIDDRGRGVLLLYRGDYHERLRVSAGLMHRSHAGHFGVWDTLAHGEWRQRNAALVSLERTPLPTAATQATLRIHAGLWGHDDARQLAGPGLVLRDADLDGNPEAFTEGVLFTNKQTLWNTDVELEVTQRLNRFRVGLALDGLGAGLISGSVHTNRSDAGVALGELLSHPLLGDRAPFVDGYGRAGVVASARDGEWSIKGFLGAVAAPRVERRWSGRLELAQQRPGRRIALRVWSKPQLRLLDRHLAPEGYLAQGLSDSMPYGRAVVDSGDGLPAPFSEGVRFDGAARVARSSGIWRYGLDLGLEQLAHSADGIDRSGTAAPMWDDGSVRSWWVGGRMDFAAFSGLRFHGSIWLGNSFAQAIAGRGSDPPDLDQPWVALTEEPTWRWRNTIAQAIGGHWMTGGGLEAMSPLQNSSRSALTTLHRFELPTQVRIDAWIRYQRDQLGVTLRADNAMAPYLLAPLPRPDRVPGLLPVSPRRVVLSLEWRPGGRAGRVDPF